METPICLVFAIPHVHCKKIVYTEFCVFLDKFSFYSMINDLGHFNFSLDNK